MSRQNCPAEEGKLPVSLAKIAFKNKQTDNDIIYHMCGVILQVQEVDVTNLGNIFIEDQ